MDVLKLSKENEKLQARVKELEAGVGTGTVVSGASSKSPAEKVKEQGDIVR